MSDAPLFFLMNGYASGYSAIAYKNNLTALMVKDKGTVEMGELTIRESGEDGRLLPCGIFARWSSLIDVKHQSLKIFPKIGKSRI